MRIVKAHDPEILRLDQDSILARVFGFFMILMLIAFWIVYLQGVVGPDESPPVGFFLMVGGFTLLGGIVGLAAMLYSGQTIIDRRLGKVVQWHRFLWWREKNVYNLDDFESVHVFHHREWSYGVELRGMARRSKVTFNFGPVGLKSEARALAARISEFSGLRIDDGVPRRGNDWGRRS